ncbi:hypothetical protein [Clostridium sp.]|uniref:hypothetical protein n=1 Tax=Clostridium sp. TaxID=1506 RepID=UPI00290B5FC7|nr:hypothetical protein [Clostridium sp.]MDU7212476.1 hypothetical protein [Clostridium sp.]
MAEAFVLEGKVLLDAKNVMNDLDNIDKKASETGNTFDKIKSKAGDFSKSLDKWVTKALKAGSVALAGFGVASLNVGSDAQEAEQKFDAVFKNMSADAKKFVDSFSKEYNRYDADIMNMMATTQTIGKNYGLTANRALEMSKSMQQLTADVAAFNDMNDPEVHERLLAALRGEGESSEILGFSINQTTLAEYARQKGIKKSITQMSQAELVELRYGLMLKQSGDMAGYAKKESDGFPAQVKALTAKFKELTEELGKKLLPYALKFISWANENIDKLPVLVGILGGLLVTVKGFFIITKIKQALDAWNIATATSTTVTKGATLAQKGLNLAWLSSPITWIIGGIMLLIGAIVLLWNKSDAFKADVLASWDTIKTKFQEFDDFLNNIFAVDWSTAFGSFGNVINAFLVNVKGVWDSIKRIFGGIIDFIGGVFSGDWDRAWQGVKDIFGGIMGGLGAVIKAPLNAVIGLINGAIQGINSAISFTVPDWIPGLGGKGFSVNIPKINYLENGGIFTRPTMISPNIMTGEKNKGTQAQTEVMIPLDRLEQWIKWLASRPVAIDGRELMRVVAPYQDELEEYNNRFAY